MVEFSELAEDLAHQLITAHDTFEQRSGSAVRIFISQVLENAEPDSVYARVVRGRPRAMLYDSDIPRLRIAPREACDDAGPGAVTRLALRCRELADAVGVPVHNASEANHAALSTLGARRVAVVTPFCATCHVVRT